MSESTNPPTAPLARTVDAVISVARKAGANPDQARTEAERLAAAVAESAPGAYVDWSDALGRPRQAQPFFDAASKGRRWRSAPTAVLSQLVLDGSAGARAYAEALAEVAAAAIGLGQPTMRVAGNASVAAAAQLSAVRARPASTVGPDGSPGLPQAEPTLPTASTPPTDVTDPGQGQTPEREVEQSPATEPTPKSLEELLADLDALTGLKEVKAEIHRQVAVLRVEALRSEAGLKSATMTRHLVFVGNPGTGKTTVARLVGGIYRALELLAKGQLIEVDRSDLVAGYLGQTAIKTSEVIASAEGGVLFIDEAYSLAGDQYGTEAVDTLVKDMEDKRDRLVVIVAGYPDPMAIFVAQNPGLASRFRTTIEFTDYDDADLTEIFLGLAADADYDVTPDCRVRFESILQTTPRGPTFGNGRFARNLLEAAIGRHAWRLRDIEEPTVAQLRELEADDLEQVDAAAEDLKGES